MKIQREKKEENVKGHKGLQCFCIGLTCYLSFTLLFIAMFHISLVKVIEVFFYRGCIILVITGCLLILTMSLIKKYYFPLLDVRDILMTGCIFMSINLTVFTLAPVTVERSVSVYLLCQMDSGVDYSYSEKELEANLINHYVQDYQAVDKRIEEQLVSGTIQPYEDGYQLTKQGKRMVWMFRVAAKLFDCDETLLNEEVSNVN